MTIKELEERTGMARANIRYYESEGLLSPSRLPNGYRDYSEEDAATLEKVRLLRELRMDIDTIRLVQKGELALDKALFNQLTRLEGDRDALDRSAQVCRELEQAGVEYEALDARAWLTRLEAPARPAVAAPPPRPAPRPRTEWDKTDYGRHHPWMRYFARGVDTGLCSLLLHVIAGLGFRADLTGLSTPANWIFEFAALGITLVLEPLWLHFWGWTPGKWIFGLKVRDREGDKLPLSVLWARCGGVFSSGYGFFIPFYTLWRHWKSFQCCTEENIDCPWDAENGVRYTHEDRRYCRLMWAGAQALYVFLLVAVALQSLLPPNRGDLTAAEYCENFNYYLARFDTGRRVDDSGRWVDRTASGTIVIDWSTVDYADLSLETEDGAVTAVTLSESVRREEDGTLPGAILMSQNMYQCATLALAGAQEGIDCFSFDAEGWAGLWTDWYETGERDHRGLILHQRVECSGYEKSDYALVLEPSEAESGGYTRTVTISLNE